MPTGYTAAVQDGKITEFREFAMSCARAFGAAITMRDDPADTPIPKSFQPGMYNKTSIAEAHAKIENLEAMSDEDKRAAAQKSFDDKAKSWDEREARKAEGVARYMAMLAKVDAWSPPTPEHTGLKDFMSKQLHESIRFDGAPSDYRLQLKSPDEWFSEALREAYDDLARHSKAQSEEIERVQKRNEWVRSLRSSLNGKPEGQ